MKGKVLNAYQPPEHFEEVKKLPSLVEEAADDNTELWLIRFPANEFGPADLQEKKANIKVDVQGGIVGHFCNSQGEEYNIVKQGNVRTLQPYAYIPNGADPWVVRKIACQVSFVKSLKVEHANGENSHHRPTVRKIAGQVGFAKSLKAEHADGENSHHRPTEVGATEHEQTTSGLASEREQDALLDVEEPSKKKMRHGT